MYSNYEQVLNKTVNIEIIIAITLASLLGYVIASVHRLIEPKLSNNLELQIQS